MIIRWMLRRFWKFIKWILLGIGLYAVVAFCLGLIPLPGEAKPELGVLIFVVSNGVHTDFCLPVEHPLQDWRGLFPLEREFPGKEVRYLSIGWGDLEFFTKTPTWDDLKISTALQAAFWPSKSALHITPRSQEPQINTRCRRLFLSEDQYRRLCTFIKEHIILAEDGTASRIQAGYGGGDMFYHAKGTYHLIRTCNEWTSQGLHRAGIQTALWAPFPLSVMVHLP